MTPAVALRMKGETADEIAGCARALRRRGERVVTRPALAARLVDTCGTGGDALGTINVSTLSAFVAAGACLRSTGLAFLFAPRFVPALRHAAPARRSLGMRTIFNLLGPLCNPAGARRQVMGLFDRTRLHVAAEALRALGARRAMLVHGHDGMDEVTVTGPTHVVGGAASSWREGAALAAESIDRGRAREKIEHVCSFRSAPSGSPI